MVVMVRVWCGRQTMYRRTDFNCVVKRLHFRVLKANCESNYCESNYSNLGSPVLATPMRCFLNAFKCLRAQKFQNSHLLET